MFHVIRVGEHDDDDDDDDEKRGGRVSPGFI
jgi:hypothetical protein